MNKHDVQQEVLMQTGRCTEVFFAKQKEYHNDTDEQSDHLENFKRAAQLQKCTPEEALLGMWMKHIISIVDMIKSHQEFSKDLWLEKITDAINYLILLRCLIMEHPNLDEPTKIEKDLRSLREVIDNEKQHSEMNR